MDLVRIYSTPLWQDEYPDFENSKEIRDPDITPLPAVETKYKEYRHFY